jgi:UTP-glucose-1-phosphate uridylyltransferase
VIELFRFIDRVTALPPELQQQFKQEVKTYQEERKMPLLSRIEEEAMEAGIQRGILQTRREDIKEILEMRFENIPLSLNEALNKINDELLLKSLHRQAITVNSLA